jgi:hypothetical protein
MSTYNQPWLFSLCLATRNCHLQLPSKARKAKGADRQQQATEKVGGAAGGGGGVVGGDMFMEQDEMFNMGDTGGMMMEDELMAAGVYLYVCVYRTCSCVEDKIMAAGL